MSRKDECCKRYKKKGSYCEGCPKVKKGHKKKKKKEK